MISITASPAAAQTGLPPKVLKYSRPLWNDSEMASVQTTAASGIPLPNGFPCQHMPKRGERVKKGSRQQDGRAGGGTIVTMSGVTPCCWKPQ